MNAHFQASSSAVRRGVLLAGGAGTRLHPATLAASKQLLPVFDKPMIYYPLSVLMLSGIREDLIVATPVDRPAFERLLGDGRQFGLSLRYAEQPRPEGIAQALVIGRDFLEGQPSALALGDNLFYGHGLSRLLRAAAQRSTGATVFAYSVRDPARYGVVEIDPAGRPLTLEEKPSAPRSSLAVTGLYFFDSRAPAIAERLRPSARGELEITDVNRAYLERDELSVSSLSRGCCWMDMGTHEALLQASNFVHAIQERQGLKIACLEEIAFRQGWLAACDLLALSNRCGPDHARYLQGIVEEAARRARTRRGTAPVVVAD